MVRNSIGFIVSFIISLFIFEIFIQKAEIESPSITDFDQQIGRKRRANINYTFFNEGFSMGKFNEYSYLGPSCPPKRSEGTYRIAILGDSYVESFQLFRRDKFHTIIENTLSKDLGKKVEVLNFGRSGFDLADMYAYQQRFVNKFNPDLVIYFLANADLLCSQNDGLIPKVVKKGDLLEVTNSLMPKSYLASYQKTKVLTQNSSIFQMINSTRKLIKSGRLLPKLLDKFYIANESEKKSNEEHGSHKVVVPEMAFLIQQNLSKNTIIVNRDKTQLSSEFSDKLKKYNIAYVDVNDTLNVLRGKGSDPNYWQVTNTSGHWNYGAHKAVGKFLAEKIAKLLKNETISTK